MRDAEKSQPVVCPASADQLQEAVRLVFSHLSPEDGADRIADLQSDLRSGRASPEGLYVARRGGRLVGAMFSQVQPGKTALLLPPRTVGGEPLSTRLRLIAATCQWLARRRVQVAHALLEPGSEDDRAFLDSGFAPLARLLYLVSPLGTFPQREPSGDLVFEPYDRANHDRMVRVMEATYEKTLDCPGLDNVRDIEDVLAGYRATGVFAPEHWLIVRRENQDIGCLLLTDHPESDQWELIYMGLVVSARGHGWGLRITRYAQWLTRLAGRARLVAAVDQSNTPALAIYSAAGFEVWDRRMILQKLLV